MKYFTIGGIIMRKMFKMIRENILVFLNIMFLLVALVATLFVPNMVYALYAGYVCLIVNVIFVVKIKVLRICQIVTLLVAVFCVWVGHVQSVAAMTYVMHPMALGVWIGEFLSYQNFKELKKK